MNHQLAPGKYLKRSATAVLFLSVLLAGCASEGTASCAAPEITLSTAEVARGDEMVVDANNLWADCLDAGEGVAGPASAVTIVLVYGGADMVSLATVDAGADGTIHETVRIPTDAHAGAAELRVGEFYSAPLTIIAAP